MGHKNTADSGAADVNCTLRIFFYVTGILISLLIEVLVVKVSTDTAVVSFVSFALTLASIVLAVVAIFLFHGIRDGDNPVLLNCFSVCGRH